MPYCLASLINLWRAKENRKDFNMGSRSDTNPLSDVRKSRLGRRAYAPEHFAFLCAKFELYDHRLIVWRYPRFLVSVALFFVLLGARSIFFLPREKWIFPITNDRWLLIVHWSIAAPFLFGTLWQRLTVPKIAEAGQKHEAFVARRIRRKHRLIGRVTVICSIGASATSMVLAQKALAGWYVFMCWSISWMGMTILTYWYAKQKQFGAHKLWAETLSRTALAFVVGRVILVLYSYALWYGYDLSVAEHSSHVKEAYFYAVLGTGFFMLGITVQCSWASHNVERKAMIKMRWRMVRYAFHFVLLFVVVKNRNRILDKKKE